MLRLQKTFSIDDLKPIKLKKGTKLIEDSSIKSMLNPKKVQKALLECIKDNDLDSFREILSCHLELRNISEFSEETGIPRQTIYRMLKPDSNPTMNTVSTVISALVA